MIRWRYRVEEVFFRKSAATGVEVEEVGTLRLDSPWGKADRAYWMLAGEEMGQLRPGQEFTLELRPVEPEPEKEEGE